MGHIVGIDLGTTNSLVACVRGERPEILPSRAGRRLTPSVVGLDKAGKVHVGESARNQLAAAPERTIAEVKRMMGTAQKVHLGAREYTPQEISGFILRALKDDAEAALGEAVDEAVVTVPAYFTDAQRQATKDAGELAGLRVERILNEPTAAALAYGIDHLDAEAHVLVYDLGGGTFDVSVLELCDGVLEVKASAGDNQLGGGDFDRAIARWLAERFLEEHGVDLRADPRALMRLKLAAEQAKIELSSATRTQILLPFLAQKGGDPLGLEAELGREDLERLIGSMVRGTLGPVDAALRDAKLDRGAIQEVLLVGGSSRIPLVEQLLAEHFGRPPRRTVHPDEAIALGAAVQAALKGRTAPQGAAGLLVTDVCPFTLGVEAAADANGVLVPGVFSPIIARNATIPISRTETYATTADGQRAVRVRVFQGEARMVERNTLLGEYLIDGVPPAPAGRQSVAITFSYDLNGILEVDTKIVSTGSVRRLTVAHAANRLTDEERARARARLAAELEAGPPAAAPPPVDPRALLDAARLLLARGQPGAARAKLEQARALDRADVDVMTLLARALEAEGALDGALALLGEAIERRPDDALLRDERSDLLLRMGRDDDAVLELEGALELGEAADRARRLRQLARLHRRGDRLPAARAALERAIALYPDDAEALAHLREVCLELGDELAAERAATTRSAAYLLAQARRALGALDLRAAFPTEGLRRVAAALAGGDLGTARAALREVTPVERATAAQAYLLGELELIDGSSARAEAALAVCVERDPRHGAAWNRLGDLQRAAGRLREAVASYRRGLTAAPDDANGHEDLGDLLALLGDEPGAAQAYAVAARLDPGGRAGDKRRGLVGERARGATPGGRVGEIGVLGWTPVGGKVSPLEAAAVAGSGQLVITGNVGPVGREAAQVAHSCARARAAFIDPKRPLPRLDLHFHFKDTELGKDGPSSGLALFLAGVSALAGRPLREQLAATGEVTLHGELRPVGGIREKLVAAALADVRLVLAPRRNLRELRELPEAVGRRVRVQLVDTIDDALALALVGGDGR